MRVEEAKLRFWSIMSGPVFVLMVSLSCLPTVAVGQKLNRKSTRIDEIIFGDAESEKRHRFDAGNQSKVIKGALGTSARQLLQPSKEDWRGGRMSFWMKVDPQQVNYITVKFWGSDVSAEHGRLMLFMDGKQIGQRHLGDVEQLDIMHGDPRFHERFFYKTTPLPLHMTLGKGSVSFVIEAQGPIWGYGDTIERFQKAMKEPSRGIYRAYVDTDPFFEPDDDDPQGKPLTAVRIRSEPGPEILDQVKKRINDAVAKMLRDKKPPSIEGIHFLANACFTDWTSAYHNKDALNKVVRGIDHHALEYRKNPEADHSEWEGAGPAAEAVRVLETQMQRYLDHEIEGTDMLRRTVWAEYFAGSRNWHVEHRRAYTNQTIIVDTNIFRCNRALAAIYPKWAWPDKKVIRLLQEACGIMPWSGSVTDRGKPSWSSGKKYFQLTEQGLTKELGFVGAYGEIVSGMTRGMYDASRPTRTEEGDEKLKEQLIKLTRARAVFRYPLPDSDGFRAMRMEGNVGWRDWKFPGGVLYAQSANGDGDAFDIAASTMDPVLIGYAQQMLADNQYFKSVERLMGQRGYAPLESLLRAPSNYERIKKASPQPYRLPMTPGQPDFVFADPEVGVVAVKHGDNILYASLYWRARYAVNFLARVHYLTPSIERDATVVIGTKFKDSGMVYEVRDRTNAPFSKKFEGFYQDQQMRYALAGVKLPIAEIPSSVKDFKPGTENINAGKGEFYGLNYGPFSIVMNCSQSKTFNFDIPKAFRGATNMVTGKVVNKSRIKVKPQETVVLCNQ